MPDKREQLADLSERVQINLAVNRFQVAIRLLETAIEEHGEIASLYNLLGVTYQKQSEFNAAIEAFKKALELNPSYIESAMNLAIVYCDLGYYDEASLVEKKLEENLAKKGQLPSLVMGRLANQHCETAEFYARSGLTREAIEEYEKALSIYPKMPDKILKLAELEYQNERYEAVKNRLTKFHDTFYPSTKAFNLLGLIHYEAEEFTEAEYYWAQSQSVSPSDRTSKLLMKCLRQRIPKSSDQR